MKYQMNPICMSSMIASAISVVCNYLLWRSVHRVSLDSNWILWFYFRFWYLSHI